MKICHVINSLNRGGAESHLLDLINAQLNDGMDVHVTVIGEDSTESYSIESELLKNGINITSCLLYTSPSPRDHPRSRMPSSA